MGRRIDRLVPVPIRAAALMSAAALTVHQLRYEIAYGERAGSELAARGHDYLGFLMPLVAMLLAAAAGLFMLELDRAREGRSSRLLTTGFRFLWAVAATSLLAIYSGQELIEGALSNGHPGGIIGVFGNGGLVAVPLSILLGALVAAVLRGAEVAVSLVAARARVRRPRRRPASFAPPLDAPRCASAPLAASAAGRAPPLTLAPTF